ncbi:MAG: hypothetical protein WD011_02100 [Nitriliruptoraceae bacterium]
MFWIVAIIFVALLLSDIVQTRPWYLLVPVTVWGGWGEVGAYPSHAIHMLMVALIHWAVIAAVVAQVVRPQQRIGAAWSYVILGVVTLGIALAYANLPPEAVPILSGVLVFSLLAFIVHPSPMRAKFRSVAPPSRVLLALVVAAAVPLAMFAIDSFGTQLASGPGDEHFDFGHWTFMGIYPIVTVLIGLVAAFKVSGWRLPGWIAGVFILAHGLGSLLVTAASALRTVWAIAAVVWGVGFIIAIEAEANQARQVRRADAVPPTPDVPPADG